MKLYFQDNELTPVIPMEWDGAKELLEKINNWGGFSSPFKYWETNPVKRKVNGKEMWFPGTVYLPITPIKGVDIAYRQRKECCIGLTLEIEINGEPEYFDILSIRIDTSKIAKFNHRDGIKIVSIK